MIKVNKKINLAQLDNELNGLGLIATLDEDKQIVEVGLADNNTATETQLKAAINAHVAIDEAAIRATAKAELLERLGITEDEAKLLFS
jgi:hypothetical protein